MQTEEYRIDRKCYRVLPGRFTHRLIRIAPKQDGEYIQCELTITRLPEVADFVEIENSDFNLVEAFDSDELDDHDIPKTKNVDSPKVRSSSSAQKRVTYTALSYVWGKAVFDKAIVLRDLEKGLESLINITDNLHAFLIARLALQDYAWIFVDALCINQKDVLERSQQVQMMGDIYRHAQRVVVWLGDQETEIAELLNYVTSLNDMGNSFPEWVCIEKHAMKMADNPVVIRRGWEKLDHHPYWTRLWIVPEVILARALDFQHDQTVVSLGKLIHCYPYIVPLHEPSPRSAKNSVMERLLSRSRLSGNKQVRSHSLMSNLSRYAATNCADPHDKVFALLAISQSAAGFPVDYSMKMEELFLQLPWTLSRDEDRAKIMLGFGISSQSILDHARREKNNENEFLTFQSGIMMFNDAKTRCPASDRRSTPMSRRVVVPLDDASSHVGCACAMFPSTTHFFFRVNARDGYSSSSWSAVGLIKSDGSLERFLPKDPEWSWAESLMVTEDDFAYVDERSESDNITFATLSITKLAFANLIDREVNDPTQTS